MATMGLLKLFPTLRIQNLLSDPLLSVFADDRTAISTAQAGVGTIQQVWDLAESCAALQEN
eukprot:13734625-Alexandrium_andersonii.AAC.1